MRKNLPIILLSALVVIGLLVGVGYYFQTYRHGKAPEEGLTVVTAESTTASNKRTFLAENKEGDFQLYAQGDKAILVHQGKSKTFSGWSHYLTKERPKLYYTDLNATKRKNWWCDWSVVLTGPPGRSCTPMTCMCSPPISKRTAALNTILWLPTERAGSGPLPRR